MAASGFTPIQLYRSATPGAVPTAANLAPGELALNTADQKLFFENASGVVVSIDTANGTVTSVNASGGTTGLTFSGGPITTSGTLTLAGTLAVANGGTGATTFTSGRLLRGNGTSAVTASIVGDDGATVTVNGAFSTTGAASLQGSVDLGGTVTTGYGVSTGAVAMELGGLRSGNGVTLVDFHAASGTDFEARIIRNSGTNGTLDIINTGTGALTASTNGAERMRIDSSGNVGIGTSSPGAKLDVSSSTFNIVASRSTGGYAAFQRFAPTGQQVYDFYNINGVEVARITADGNNLLAFSTGSAAAERMRIDSSGNVGIGTGNPAGYRLRVVGASGSAQFRAGTDTNGYFEINAFDSAPVYCVIAGSNATAGVFGTQANIPTVLYTNNTERMRITAAGLVGVGTSAPTYQTQVAGVGQLTANLTDAGVKGATLFLQATDSNAGAGGALLFGTNSGNGTPFSTIKGLLTDGTANTLGDLAISTRTATSDTALTERMRITAAGKVGIGTSAPSYTLQVSAASGSNNVAYFVNDSVGSTLAGIVASIESGGNNTNSFHFAGVTQTVALWYLYGNGTTSYTSDIRVKKNVTTTRDGYLEDVCKLRVVKYNWYNDSDDTPRELGFIAQEVEQVFPGLVQDALHPTKDGEIHKVLKGSVMMPIMLKALQEANAKIDALTARVAQLEGN